MTRLPIRLVICMALAAAGGCAVADPPLPPVGPISRADFTSEVLGIHNAERAAAGVAPLAWDAGLAANAARYAQELGRLASLRHSPRQARAGQGENLWMGTRGAFSPIQMVQSWASERRLFRAGTFPTTAAAATGRTSAITRR